MEHYIAFWTNYANFSGRTSRSGYWMATLFNILVSFVLGIVVGFLPMLGFLVPLFSLASLIPGLAICIRRLRDAGFHWAWYFLIFLPLVGSIALIVMFCQPTKYPAAPKIVDTYAVADPTPAISPAAVVVEESRGIRISCKTTSLAGKVWHSDGEPMLAGRNPATCTICFPEGTVGVSGEHCRIYPSGGSWYVQDLDSSYGTYAGGKRLDPSEAYLLRSGENIFLGSQQVWLTVL